MGIITTTEYCTASSTYKGMWIITTRNYSICTWSYKLMYILSTRSNTNTLITHCLNCHVSGLLEGIYCLWLFISNMSTCYIKVCCIIDSIITTILSIICNLFYNIYNIIYTILINKCTNTRCYLKCSNTNINSKFCIWCLSNSSSSTRTNWIITTRI